MGIQSVKFVPGDKPQHTPLAIDRIEDLEDLKKEETLPAVYVVPEQASAILREYSKRNSPNPLIIDRNRKIPSKALYEQIPKSLKNKILLFAGEYAETGRLRQSIDTYHSKDNNSHGNILFISIDNELFKELVKDVGDGKWPEKGRKKGSRDDEREIDDIAVEFINEIRSRCNIPPDSEDRYVGCSWKAQEIRTLIALAAQKDEPVLIQGDTGTGKEIVAQRIHSLFMKRTNKSEQKDAADRKTRKDVDEPVSLNCATIPKELLEMELFGVEPNTVTGGPVKEAKIGLWEMANDSTLFLDEIGELDLRHQTKILRAIDRKVIRRVGGTKDIPVNARIVAATNCNLLSMMEKGKFREDLYYRLRSFLIRTQALRDHPEDIPLLTDFFWKRITGSDEKRLPGEIINKLESYKWPGNARELRKLLTNLYSLFGADNLKVKHLKLTFYYEGRDWLTEDEQSRKEKDILRSVQCHRHLLRIDDDIRALLVSVRPIIEKKKVEAETAESVRSLLNDRLNELEADCRQPKLFRKESIFNTVYALKGKLTYFQSLLQDDVREARENWNNSVADGIKQVQDIISREMEKVRG